MSHLTMILTRRFSDGSGTAKTVVGDRDELALAFRHALPTPLSVEQGFQLDVRFYPAPEAT